MGGVPNLACVETVDSLKLAKKLDADEVASNSIASAYKELRELDRLIRLAEADAAEDEPTADVDNGYDASAI